MVVGLNREKGKFQLNRIWWTKSGRTIIVRKFYRPNFSIVRTFSSGCCLSGKRGPDYVRTSIFYNFPPSCRESTWTNQTTPRCLISNHLKNEHLLSVGLIFTDHRWKISCDQKKWYKRNQSGEREGDFLHLIEFLLSFNSFWIF